jgi:hypothetical protein
MASQRKRVRRTPRGGVLAEKDSGAAPASTRVRGCTPSRGQSCGACLERFFEPLTGAAAPAWELLRRQTCPKWTCRTNAAACVQACERGAQKSPEVGSPHAIRAGCQPRAPAGPQHERFANCERCGAEAHATVGDARFGVQGARARRVAHRAWPRTSVWYLLAPLSPHTRPHCSPPPSGRSPSGCSGGPQRSEARRARGGRASRGRAGNGPPRAPGGPGGVWAAQRPPRGPPLRPAAARGTDPPRVAFDSCDGLSLASGCSRMHKISYGSWGQQPFRV